MMRPFRSSPGKRPPHAKATYKKMDEWCSKKHCRQCGKGHNCIPKLVIDVQSGKQRPLMQKQSSKYCVHFLPHHCLFFQLGNNFFSRQTLADGVLQVFYLTLIDSIIEMWNQRLCNRIRSIEINYIIRAMLCEKSITAICWMAEFVFGLSFYNGRWKVFVIVPFAKTHTKILDHSILTDLTNKPFFRNWTSYSKENAFCWWNNLILC